MKLHDKLTGEPIEISVDDIREFHDRAGIYTEITVDVFNTKIKVSETVPEIMSKIQEDSTK